MNKSSATKIGIFFYSAKSCPSNHSAIICSMYSSILRVTGIPACLIVVAFFLVTGETDKDICTLFSSGWMRGLPALALFPPLISCGFMGRLPSPVLVTFFLRIQASVKMPFSLMPSSCCSWQQEHLLQYPDKPCMEQTCIV